MPKILDDTRDPMKLKLGQELRRMQKEDPKALASFLSQLTEEEANEILYDQEIWCREQQWIDLSDGVPITMLLAGRGFGKAEAVDIPTFSVNKGWIKFGDLEVGDQIYDENGKPCNVTEIYEHPAGTFENYYRLYFDKDDFIDVCGEHLWNTWTHRDRKQYGRYKPDEAFPPKNWWNHEVTLYDCHGNIKGKVGPSVKTTEEIIGTFRHSSRGDLNHSVPTTLPLQGTVSEFPVDPWMYGMWLGDGGHNTGFMSCGGEDYEQFFKLVKERNIPYVCGKTKVCKSNSYYFRGLVADLRKFGLSDKDDIPSWVYHCTSEIRLDILKGLCDSDGYTNGKNVENTQKRKNIADLIHFLVVSLGGKAKTKIKKVRLPEKEEIRDYYRTIWTPTFQCFSYERKAKLIEENLGKSQASRKMHRMITSYEKINPVDMRCITVDSPSNLYLTGKSLIPTHNTYTSATTVKRAVEKHGVKDILILAPTARDFRSTIAPSIIGLYPPKHENQPYWSPSKASVIWPNGAVAICIPGEAGSDAPRGLNSAVCIVDELIRMDEEIVTQALLTLRIEPSKMVIATTPKAHPMVIDLVERSQDPDNGYVKLITGSTYENIDNLSSAFSDTVIKKYEGTRLGEQELEGKLILTNDAALWQYETITRNTITMDDVPALTKIAIGVDPAMMARSTAKGKRTPDKTGISVVGLGVDDKLYALEGHTGSYTAEGWVEKVAGLYDKYSQHYDTKIVAEINIIGKEMLMMAFDKGGKGYLTNRIRAVFATQSKLQRASPFALLSEQNKVKFVEGEYLKLLSMECTTFTGASGEKSPDSLDSFIWACSELKPAKKQFTKSYELLI